MLNLKMPHRFGIILIFTVLLSIAAGAAALRAAQAKGPVLVNCDIHNDSCTKTLDGTEVQFDINPKPVKAMQDLWFKVTLSGRLPETVPYIDLGMPGMKMGPNQVLLKHRGDGVYEGAGVIVRCPSGKKTWKAVVTVPGSGTVEFVFDVVD